MFKQITHIFLLFILVTQQIQSDPQKKNPAIVEALKKHKEENARVKVDLIGVGTFAAAAFGIFCLTQWENAYSNNAYGTNESGRSVVNNLGSLCFLGLSGYALIDAALHYFSPTHPEPEEREDVDLTPSVRLPASA